MLILSQIFSVFYLNAYLGAKGKISYVSDIFKNFDFVISISKGLPSFMSSVNLRCSWGK